MSKRGAFDQARLATESLKTDAKHCFPQAVTLSYDGSEFAGFQAQDSTRFRTVQVEVERALAALHDGETLRISGAGRTDQGVHALGQVVSFAATRNWEDGELARALNSVLPRDIRAVGSHAVPETFHARRSATSKRYRYVLDIGPFQHPTRRRYAGWTPFDLDAVSVEAAARIFLGTRDFASLQNAGSDVKTTVRTITLSDVAWTQDPAAARVLIYTIEADGFLRRMVRAIVGGLIAAGRGARSVDDLKRGLDACDRRAWPAPPADPSGLYLERADYGPTTGVNRQDNDERDEGESGDE